MPIKGRADRLRPTSDLQTSLRTSFSYRFYAAHMAERPSQACSPADRPKAARMLEEERKGLEWRWEMKIGVGQVPPAERGTNESKEARFGIV